MIEPDYGVLADGTLVPLGIKQPLAGLHANSARYGKRGRFGFMPAIEPDLAPWSQILDHLVTEFELDYYPEGALRAALATFEQQHGHAPDPNVDDHNDEVADLAAEAGGWVA